MLLLSYYYLILLDNLLFVNESCKGKKYQRRIKFLMHRIQFYLTSSSILWGKNDFLLSLNTNLTENVGFLLNDNNNTCFPGCKNVTKFPRCVFQEQYNFCYELIKSYLAWRTINTIQTDFI